MKIEDIKVGRRYYVMDGDEYSVRKVIANSHGNVCHRGSWLSNTCDLIANQAAAEAIFLCEVPRRWFQFWRWFE